MRLSGYRANIAETRSAQLFLRFVTSSLRPRYGIFISIFDILRYLIQCREWKWHSRSRELNTIKVRATEMLFPLGQKDARATVTELLHFSLFVFASLSRDLVPIILGPLRFASSMNAMNAL